MVIQRNTTHGRSYTPEYSIWFGMFRRCYDPRNKAFPNYGGRGIYVSDAWSDFATFFADMGPRPSKRHSIERKDNDGPYSKGNCKWATPTEQAANKRPRRPIDPRFVWPNSLKTHCPRGHPYSGSNLKLKPLPSGGHSRTCRICNRALDRSRPRCRKRTKTCHPE